MLLAMGDIQQHMVKASCMVSMYDGQVIHDHDHKMMNKGRHVDQGENDDDDDDNTFVSDQSTSCYESNISKDSSSSELLDDASSSTSQSNGSFELSELMDQLPIKRGLSKYYQGKCQSFTSLARVTSLEDLIKKESPYQKKLKACRSYGGGLSNFRSYTQPKSNISKKVSKSSLSNLTTLNRKGSFVGTCRSPLCPIQSSF